MLFGFRLEEFQNFGADFVVGGQCIEIGAGDSGPGGRFVDLPCRPGLLLHLPGVRMLRFNGSSPGKQSGSVP